MTDIKIIELKNFSFSFKSKKEEVVLFNNSDIKINSCESVSITGVSGSGKSTLLSLIAGLQKLCSGSLLYNSENIVNKTDDELSNIRRANFTFIFQHPYFFDDLSICDNAKLYLALKEKKLDLNSLKSLLNQFNINTDLSLKTKYLSGGERARMSIVFSLLSQAPFIFADEITGSLDEDNAHLVEDLLFDYVKRFNKTLILVTHSSSFASKCEHQYKIENKSIKKIC